MKVDPGLLALMRDDLSDLGDLREVRMFGALCFMYQGHMLCGIHPGGALYRVGKAHQEAALMLSGAAPMEMSGRRMSGFIEVAAEALEDDENRAEWLRLCLQNHASLPPR